MTGEPMGEQKELSSDYLDGWREGVCAYFVAIVSLDSGGFIEAKDKDGKVDQFLPVNFLMGISTDLRLHPHAPRIRHDDKLDGPR
jgi:hypothetical protein